MAAPGGKHTRRKRLLWAGGILALALAAFVIFLPALLSSSLLRGRVISLLGPELGPRVELDSLALSWFGDQEVQGFRLKSLDGAASKEDLLDVQRVSVRSGLLRLLWSGGEGLEIEVEEPALRISRGSDGSFNFEDLFSAGKTRPAGPLETPGAAPSSRERAAGLSAVPRGLAITVSRGSIHYTDAVLGAASSILGLEATVRREAAALRLEGKAQIVPSGGPPGSFSVSAEATEAAATAKGESSGEPAVSATAVVTDLDLRPYRSLMEEFLGLSPPTRPVAGKFTLQRAGDGLVIQGGLDVGAARVNRLTLKVPPPGRDGAATLEAPIVLDLASTVAMLSPRIHAPEGSRVEGTLEGTLRATADVGLQDLLEGGAGEKRLGVRLDAGVRDLDLAWPRGASNGGEAVPPPLRLARDRLDLSLDVSTGAGGEVAIRSVKLSTRGIEADLSGSIRRPGGRDRSPPAPSSSRGTQVNVTGVLDLSTPDLLALLAASLPSSVKLDPESRLRLRSFSLQTTEAPAAAGGAPGSWEGKAALEVSGPVTWSGFSATRAAGNLLLRKDRLEFSAFDLDVNGGRIAASEAVVIFGTPVKYRVQLDAQALAANYDMTPVLAYAVPFLAQGPEDAVFSGNIRSKLELQGEGFSLDDLRRSLRGRGSLRIADGKISGSHFFGKLAELLRTRFGEVLFSELGSDFAIGGGKVNCERVFLVGSKDSKLRNLGLKGTTDLDGGLDYGTRLSALKEAAGDRRFQRVLDYARKVLPDDAFPLRLKGSLSSPAISLAPDLADVNLGGLLDELLSGRKSRDDAPGGSAKKDARRQKPKEVRIKDIIDIFRKRD